MALTFIKSVPLDAGVKTPVFTSTPIRRNLLFQVPAMGGDESRLVYYIKQYFDETIKAAPELVVYRTTAVFDRNFYYENVELDPVLLYLPKSVPISGFITVDVYYYP